MPAYTIFPYTEGGTALMFEASTLANDAAAIRRAEQLFDEHHLAIHVEVWESDRKVYSRERRDGRASDLVWAYHGEGKADPAGPCA